MSKIKSNYALADEVETICLIAFDKKGFLSNDGKLRLVDLLEKQNEKRAGSHERNDSGEDVSDSTHE